MGRTLAKLRLRRVWPSCTQVNVYETHCWQRSEELQGENNALCVNAKVARDLVDLRNLQKVAGLVEQSTHSRCDSRRLRLGLNRFSHSLSYDCLVAVQRVSTLAARCGAKGVVQSTSQAWNTSDIPARRSGATVRGRTGHLGGWLQSKLVRSSEPC